ncbi:MAG TPA: class III extradiol ring-cleavage dioxygenase [Terriglobia bacterium]|nr:class III extradiol ring-cleavage dioxygenase [Terriglobia bacterium]
MQPSLFLSHGAPTLPLTSCPAHDFLVDLGLQLKKPRAILVASAHWETATPAVSAVAANETIHDFYGFPQALYQLTYPAPGLPELAESVSDLLCTAGLACQIDHHRGLDHGAWVPLMLMFPEADVPVLQLSLQQGLGPAHHLQLGRALAPLREQDVLIVGSGSLTHDLSRFRGQRLDSPAAPDVDAFADWMTERLMRSATCDLLTYRRQAPYAAAHHPSEEHLLPLFVACGAGGEKATAQHLHRSTTFGFLRMDAFAFG